MKKEFLGIVFLVCESLGGAQVTSEVLAKIARKMSVGQWGQPDDIPVNRICGGCYLVPVCHENSLFLAVFIKNVLTKIQGIALKEGVFVPDTVLIKDKTSRSRAKELRKNREELARRKRNYQFVSLKQEQAELFKYELAQEKMRLREQYGSGTRMVRVDGESIPLEARGRMWVLQCEAVVDGETIHLEVDVANFCDGDAWAIIDPRLPTFEEPENYFSGVNEIDCVTFV